MSGTVRFMADFATGLAVLVAAMGLLVLLFGCLVVVEAYTTGPQSAASGGNALVAADLLVRKAQVWLNLAPVKLAGSHAMSLGLKITAGALVAAIPLDMMYSQRVAAERGRR